MKNFILIIFLLLSAGAFAQNASTYFPANTGYKWYYKNTPLDSLNNPITNLTTYRIDSFAVVQNYNGRSANIVYRKDFLTSFNQPTPYNDTAYYNFETTNGWEYLFARVDSAQIPFPQIIGILYSLKNWYSIYRFAQSVNSEYTLIQKDTTISFDTISAPLRFKYKAKRLSDQTVSTVNGTYTAKRFVTISGVYYRFLILEIPILERPDTTWFAHDVWMVKKVTPSVNVDLNSLGIPLSFSVPGNAYELENSTVGVQNISSEIPVAFSLQQNYPNPFNPETNIKFSVPESAPVKLSIFDITGKDLQTLINQNLSPGTYQAQWNAANYPSGTYFCKLQSGSFSQTKRMTLLK